MMLGEVGARMARDGKRGGVSVLVFLVSLGQLTFFGGASWSGGQVRNHPMIGFCLFSLFIKCAADISDSCA